MEPGARPSAAATAGNGAAVVVEPPDRWRALAVLATAVFLAMTTWFSASAVTWSGR